MSDERAATEEQTVPRQQRAFDRAFSNVGAVGGIVVLCLFVVILSLSAIDKQPSVSVKSLVSGLEKIMQKTLSNNNRTWYGHDGCKCSCDPYTPRSTFKCDCPCEEGTESLGWGIGNTRHFSIFANLSRSGQRPVFEQDGMTCSCRPIFLSNGFPRRGRKSHGKNIFSNDCTCEVQVEDMQAPAVPASARGKSDIFDVFAKLTR